MSGKKNRRAPSATPWDDLPESQIAPSQAIVKAARDGIYSFRRERFSGDADFFNGYPRSERPHCGSAKVKRNGANRNGAQVCRRLSCGRTSTPIAGTIFDDSKLPVTAWADFILQAISLESEAYNAKLLKGLPDELNPLEPVNRLRFLLKCFLRAHSGFNRDNIQGFLNLLSVATNPPSDKLEKAAFALDRAMRCPKTLRFRDFYNVKTRSDGSGDEN